MATDLINEAVEAAVADWLPRFILQRKEALRRKKMMETGELQGGIEGEIEHSARADAVKALIAFNEKGRWLDMRPRRGVRVATNTINRVASGVKLRRKRKNTKWWNRAKTAGVAELYNLVAAGLPDATADTLLSQFPNK